MSRSLLQHFTPMYEGACVQLPNMKMDNECLVVAVCCESGQANSEQKIGTYLYYRRTKRKENHII